MTRPVLEVVDLCKTFPVRSPFGRLTGEVKAVNSVSFSIERGKVYGLAGESGSGKSTIARMIMGLTPPTSGDILLDGESIGAIGGSAAHRRKVQMVFQNPGSSLNPRRSVAQSITVPLHANGYPRADRARRVSELLDMVQLPASYAERYPHELSGGQKQRVAIARALAVAPKLLVLDEPTSALDVSVQAQVLELMTALQEEFGLTYLLISHNLAVIRQMADAVGVLHNGVLVESGPVEEIFGNPQAEYTRMLLDAVPDISKVA